MARLSGRWNVLFGLAAGGVLGLIVLNVGALDASVLAQGLSALLLTSPTPAAELSGTVVLSAISGTPDLEAIQFQINGVDLGSEITQGQCSAAWNTAAGSDGAYLLTVVGRFTSGQLRTSAPVAVTVRNSRGGPPAPVPPPAPPPEPPPPAPRPPAPIPVPPDPPASGPVPEPPRVIRRTRKPIVLRKGTPPSDVQPAKVGCRTPNPFAKLPGVIGTCVRGVWMVR